MAAGRKMIKAEPAQYESEIASGVNTQLLNFPTPMQKHALTGLKLAQQDIILVIFLAMRWVLMRGTFHPQVGKKIMDGQTPI